MYLISEEEKRMAVTLAMKIDIGEVSIDEVINAFDAYPLSGSVIVAFWTTFNDMTRQVAKDVGMAKCRKHLEICYRKEAKRCGKTNFMKNGLKLIWCGVMECLIGAGLIPKNTGTDRKD